MKKVPGSSSVVESAHNDENLSFGKSLLGGDSVSNSTVKQRPTNLHLKILQDDTKSSQPETCSSSSSEFRVDRLNIDFRNLTYTVNSGILRRERKTLVSGLNGSFHAGELSAIMGPSGAGKTTLLNILSGYIINNYSGSISVNGFQRDLKWFKTQSAYITQDTEIQAYLSVSEAMYFSANLKIGNSLTNAKKRERVRKILEAIGMYDTRHTRSEKLSGGQKKRLSIALELVTNPPILILDEPTSGLDSSTSTQCLSLLKQLAEQGRTIIFTVHQPSAILFGMFDHLYTIAEGKCIFSGGTKSVVPFLNELGLKCPESYNPADYLLEIANNDYGPQNDKLIAKVQNGLCEDYRKNTQITTSQIEVMTKVERMVEAGLLTPVKAPGFKPTNSPPFNSDTGSSSLRDINGTIATKLNRDDKLSASCYEIDPEKVRLAQRGYSSTFLQQLTYLLMRTFLIRWRNKSLTATKLLIHIVMGVLVGNLYYGIGEDAHHIMNTFRYIFFSIMFNMHTAFASVILNFPLEFPIVSREHFNRWYSLRAYYIALTIADIPVQLLCSFLFMIISYFLTNQPMDVVRIALLYVMIVLSSLVAQSIGLTVGASLDVKNGAIFGPFFICPFLIFSGFFIQIKDVHEMMQWLFHISFLKYSLEGASLALFGYDRPQMECTEIFCQFIRPKRFLKAVGMEQASYEFDVVALIVIFLILRVIAFYIMSIRLKLFR